jgi:hypothetical protein
VAPLVRGDTLPGWGCLTGASDQRPITY